MKVLFAGASGTIGMPAVRMLVDSGHDVVAVHRAADGGDKLRALGADPLRVDVLDREALLAAVAGKQFDAVISELTALKKVPVRHRDMALTNRLRTDGTRNLLEVAKQTGARRFVSQSMVFGYGYGSFGDRVLTESDPFAPPGHGRFEEHLAAMRVNENLVLGADHLDGIALRYGLLYGPGPASDVLVDGLYRRRVPVVRSGKPASWVFADDAAAATVAALERGAGATAYNVVDDEPVSFAELVTSLAVELRAPRPRGIPEWLLSATPYAKAILLGGLRVSNAKAKHELGWAPSVSSYRQGVAQIAAARQPGTVR